MIRRPPRSTQGVSSAASDVYKRQVSTQSTWGMKIATKRKKKTSIEVAIRMRPLLLPFEDECAWKVDSPNGAISTINNLQPTLDLSPGNFNPLLLRDRDLKRRFTDIFQSYSFRFDNVFGQEINTQQIYCKVGRKITKEAMNGYNGTVLVYGQTTSGKTFTMLGSPENPGILPCALRDIFKGISSDIEHDYSVWVSYICLLYTSPSPRDLSTSRMPSSA
eukprot:TRINITY_DN25990_c0_g1_i1.p2 TRINITY_DN25990_c0_g1~~TRINITY_DN25990_c0_g1_i1.p2  ORF type:complete len:219 (-),score=46.77 TRINITY_DN25990_c0_g1_i1:149-805(-)